MHGPGTQPPELTKALAGEGRLEGPAWARAVKHLLNLATERMGGEPPFKPVQPGMVIAERPDLLDRALRGAEVVYDEPLTERVMQEGRPPDPGSN